MRIPTRFVWFKKPVKYILILGYYRSGSSFLGDIIQQAANTCYIYEPLQLFTKSKRINNDEIDEALYIIENYFQCQFDVGPSVNLNRTEIHHWNYKWMKWLFPVCLNRYQKVCPSSTQNLTKLCLPLENRVIKSVRLPMSALELFMLSMDPFIDFNIIYLVRDPRAMFNSRTKHPWCTSDPECIQPQSICQQMREDINTYNRLVKLYPNKLSVTRHEDISMKPEETVQRLYKSLNLPFTDELKVYLYFHTSNLRKSGKYSVIKHSKTVVNQWMKQMKKDEIEEVQEYCEDVFKLLGYVNISDEFLSALQPNSTNVLPSTFENVYSLSNAI
uniref:Sulfotransferase domain-containing protein n=1 Tax=Tetranychus urticae TaxID=32264 RepID=T1JVN5_TETUR